MREDQIYHSPDKADPDTPDSVRARLHILDWFNHHYPEAVSEFLDWEQDLYESASGK